jgi:hypothetical protein
MRSCLGGRPRCDTSVRLNGRKRKIIDIYKAIRLDHFECFKMGLFYESYIFLYLFEDFDVHIIYKKSLIDYFIETGETINKYDCCRLLVREGL